MRPIEEIKADIERIKNCYKLLENNECNLTSSPCSDCDYDVEASEIELIDELMEHYTKYENAERDGRLISIPKVIFDDFLNKYYSAINISINSTDVVNGYGKRITYGFEMLRYSEWCNKSKCSYDSIYNPNPKENETRCQRHTLERGYRTMYFNSSLHLNELFDEAEQKLKEREL